MEAMGVEPFIFGRTFHPMIRAEDFPEARALAQGVIGLPIHQQLTPGDMTLVAEALFASWIE
jgi:dTDP-4-amino-4,6-dideoxygalactose transaminase